MSRPRFTGDEPAFVLKYARGYENFPHETTVDQFFSESQFESYRALGHHMAREIFKDAVDSADVDSTRALFSTLRRRWFPPPPYIEKNFFEAAKGFEQIHQGLQSNSHLTDLMSELYGECFEGPLETQGDHSEPKVEPKKTRSNAK